MRAGATTEARQAGAKIDDVKKVMDDSAASKATAEVYDRDKLEAHRGIAKARASRRRRSAARSLAVSAARVPTAKHRALSAAARQRKADDRVADLVPIVKELQAAGVTSLRAIAAALNEKRIPTSRGNGEWTATQVIPVLERLDPFVDSGTSGK